jgi:hypothetical protein
VVEEGKALERGLCNVRGESGFTAKLCNIQERDDGEGEV